MTLFSQYMHERFILQWKRAQGSFNEWKVITATK